MEIHAIAPMNQTSNRLVALGKFTRVSLRKQARRQGVPVDALLGQAMSHYLADRDSGRAAWRFPTTGRDRRELEPVLEVSVADDDWIALESEAKAQHVPASRLLEHAALYYLADLATGRLTDSDRTTTHENEGPPA
jgi:hypothetical protein